MDSILSKLSEWGDWTKTYKIIIYVLGLKNQKGDKK